MLVHIKWVLQRNGCGSWSPGLSYETECESIECSSFKDSNDGTELSIQLSLAYTALVNLNNYLNGIYSALLGSGTVGGLVSGAGLAALDDGGRICYV